MKKKIFIGLAVTFALAIAVVCTTVSSVNSAPPMSDLMAKNIEALTQVEEAPESDCRQGCTSSSDEICIVLYSNGTWKYCDEQRAI